MAVCRVCSGSKLLPCLDGRVLDRCPACGGRGALNGPPPAEALSRAVFKLLLRRLAAALRGAAKPAMPPADEPAKLWLDLGGEG